MVEPLDEQFFLIPQTSTALDLRRHEPYHVGFENVDFPEIQLSPVLFLF